MDLGLQGKSVIVTGGSKGIGLACARLFASEGARVGITSRSSANIERACAELPSSNLQKRRKPKLSPFYPTTATLVGQNRPVPYLVLLNFSHRVVCLAHGKAFGNGLHSVPCGDIQHLVQIVWTS